MSTDDNARTMTVTVWVDHGKWSARVDHDGPTIIYDGYDSAVEIYDQLADVFAQWDIDDEAAEDTP